MDENNELLYNSITVLCQCCMQHIPLTKYHLLAAHQEPYKKN